MRRWVAGVVLVLLSTGGVSVRAQTFVFNPTAVDFDHEEVDWDKTTAYRFEVWNETETVKFYEFSVPKTAVTTVSGVTRRVATRLFPPAPIGVTYKIRMVALGDCEGAVCPSPPSNFAPQLVRYSACFNPTTRRNEPVVVRMTGPSSVQVGMYYPLAAGMLTITGPSRVTSVSIEALGDGYPALYYTMEDARSGPPLVLGPFRRVGSFALTIKAVDDRGCEGVHATPFPRITVTP